MTLFVVLNLKAGVLNVSTSLATRSLNCMPIQALDEIGLTEGFEVVTIFSWEV